MSELEPGARQRHAAADQPTGWLAPWSPGFSRLDDWVLDAYQRLSDVSGADSPLSATQATLIRITVSSAVGGLQSEVLREHVRQALELGISAEQIVEVFQLVSGIAMVSSRRGLPVLSELVGERPLSERQQALRRRFEEQRGYWAKEWDAVLQWNPRLFETHLECSRIPWLTGTLDASTRELIYIALDAAITVNNEAGLKSHMTRALELGVDPEAIVQVLAIASGFGLTSLALGLRLLDDESNRDSSS